MPRGGRREGAGRKTQWASGCSFPETTIIRVPKVLKNELLEIAHRLDAGEEIDLVSKSIIAENQSLKNEIEILKSQFSGFSQLELLPTNKDTSNLDILCKKAKDLLYQESLVRPRDRSPIKKLLSSLFDMDKSYFDKKK